MPSLITVRGKKRYRGTVMVRGVRNDQLFPNDSKDSMRAAAEWERKRKQELIEQMATHTESISIETWFQEYLDDVQDRYSIKTYQEKRGALDRLAKQKGITSDLQIEKVTVSMCRGFLKEQFKNRSGYAANKDRKNLAVSWDWGRDNIDGWPKLQNPFRQIKKYPEIRSPRYVPPAEHFWKVCDQIDGDDPISIQDKTMLTSFLHLAGRRNEIFGLKLKDLDFPNSKVRLWTRKRENGNLEEDWLPMTKELKAVLLKWLETRMSIKGIDPEYVFICLDKTPFCDQYFGKPFKKRQHFMKRLCEKAKVKPFGFHAIRHLTATILYHKGYKVSHIQAVLRHKSAQTTERYLKSLGLEFVREVLDEGLKGPVEIIPFKKQLPSDGRI